MERLRIYDVRKRIYAYHSEKSLTYIKDNLNSFYNGYIHEVKTDIIIFFDIVLKRSIPVLIDSIVEIQPSKKNISEKEAIKIYEVWKNVR